MLYKIRFKPQDIIDKANIWYFNFIGWTFGPPNIRYCLCLKDSYNREYIQDEYYYSYNIIYKELK